MSFSDEGHFIGFVGTKGEGPGEFENSTSVVVGPGDSVYVFDSELSRLIVFEPTALQYAYSISTPARPLSLLGVTNSGYIFRFRQLYSPPNSSWGGYDPDETRYSSVSFVGQTGDYTENHLSKITCCSKSRSNIWIIHYRDATPFWQESIFCLQRRVIVCRME